MIKLLFFLLFIETLFSAIKDWENHLILVEDQGKVGISSGDLV